MSRFGSTGCARVLWRFVSVAICMLVRAAGAVGFAKTASESSFDIMGGYKGEFVKGDFNDFYLFNYYTAGLSFKIFLKAYTDSGEVIGSIQHSIQKGESVGVINKDRYLVLGSMAGRQVFGVQTAALNSLAFTSLTLDSSQHDRGYSYVLADLGTIFVYSTLFKTDAGFYLTGEVRLYRIDSSNFANEVTKQLSVNQVRFSFSQQFYQADYILTLSTSRLYISWKSSLDTAKEYVDSSLGYMVEVDGSDDYIMYLSTKRENFAAENVLKVSVENAAQASYQQLCSVTVASTYITNIKRLPTFRNLFLNAKDSNQFFLADVDTCSMVTTKTISGNLFRTSLVMGQLTGISLMFAAINTGAWKIESYKLLLDFCLVPGQNPCIQCIAGRYLSSNLFDNLCLRTSEFPASHGINGIYFTRCFGLPAADSGCLSCVADYQQCTACGNSNGFYLNPLNQTCQQIPAFDASYGLDTASKLVMPCTVTNCLDCRYDIGVCSECKASYYLSENSSSSCKQNNVDGFGLKSVAGKNYLSPCTVADCKECKPDAAVCTACVSGKYFKEASTTACFSNSLEQYGLKTSAGSPVLAVCSDGHCRICQSDYTVCAQCYTPYYSDGSGCSLGVAGSGFDPMTNSLKPCLVANCIDCGSDYRICVGCAPTYYLLEGRSDVCSSNNQLGKGLKQLGADHVIAVCAVANCEACYQDVLTCEGCQTGFYLKEGQSANCFENNIAGFGLKQKSTTSTVLAACLDSDCSECFVDWTVCTVCKPGFFQKLGQESSNPSCFTNTLSGLGLDLALSPNKLALCVAANCGSCYPDHSVCDGCLSSFYQSVDGTDCIPNDRLGFGLVASPGGSRIAGCKPANCVSCFEDANKCMSCEEGYLVHPITRACVLNNIEGFGKYTDDNNTQLLKECLDSLCSNCKALYSECEQCKQGILNTVNRTCLLTPLLSRIQLAGPTVFIVKDQSFSLDFTETIDEEDFGSKASFELVSRQTRSLDPSKYAVELKKVGDKRVQGKLHSQESIESSDLYIRARSLDAPVFKNANNMFDPSQAIAVEAVAFSPFDEEKKKLQPGWEAAQSTVIIGSVLSMGMGSTGGSRLSTAIKVIDSVEFVLYLNGIRVLKGDSFLYLLNKGALQILPNVLAVEEEKVACSPIFNFRREAVSCSLLNNLGSELLSLLGLAALALVLLAASSGMQRLHKKLGKKSFLVRVLEALLFLPNKLLTPSLVFTLFEGSQTDFIRAALLNLSTASKSNWQIIGAIVSLLLLGLYAALGFLTCRFVRQHYSKKEKRQGKAETEASKQGYMYSVFEDYRQPVEKASQVYLYTPTVTLCKTLLTQSMLVFAADASLGQIWVIFGLEVLFIGFVLVSKPFKTKWSNLHLFVSSLIIGIVDGVILLANYQGRHLELKRREQFYGLTLISLYATAIVLGILPSILDTLSTLFHFLKQLFQLRKAKNSTAPKKSLFDEPVFDLKDKQPKASMPGAFPRLQQHQVSPIITRQSHVSDRPPLARGVFSQPKYLLVSSDCKPVSRRNLQPIGIDLEGFSNTQHESEMELASLCRNRLNRPKFFLPTLPVQNKLRLQRKYLAPAVSALAHLGDQKPKPKPVIASSHPFSSLQSKMRPLDTTPRNPIRSEEIAPQV